MVLLGDDGFSLTVAGWTIRPLAEAPRCSRLHGIELLLQYCLLGIEAGQLPSDSAGGVILALTPFSWFVSAVMESLVVVSCFSSEDSAATWELRYWPLVTLMYAVA